MSLTLINEAGSASANAYVSLATAGLYIEEDTHRHSTWAALSTTTREKCIIFATTLMDIQMNYRGVKASNTQALSFPRDDLYDRSEFSITSTDIPIDIQRACSFYAYYLSQSDRLSEDSTLGFSRLDAGSLRMDIDKYDRKSTMPNIIYDMLKWYGNKSTSYPRVLKRR